jgi:hypothetical protein
MTRARYAGLTAVVWLALIATAGPAYSWSAMPMGPTGPAPPAPIRLTTGQGVPLRWIAVGISGGLCVVLLGCALLLAIRSRGGGRTSLFGMQTPHSRRNRSMG